jgi:hypothetical protein
MFRLLTQLTFLKAPVAEDRVFRVSHIILETRTVFEEWTKEIRRPRSIPVQLWHPRRFPTSYFFEPLLPRRRIVRLDFTVDTFFPQVIGDARIVSTCDSSYHRRKEPINFSLPCHGAITPGLFSKSRVYLD